MADQPTNRDQPARIVEARPVWYARTAPTPDGWPMPGVSRRAALLALALILFAMIVVPYFPDLLIPIAPSGAGVPVIDERIVVRKWCEMGLAVALLILFMLWHHLRPRTFGLRRDHIGRQLLLGLAGLGGLYATLLASALIMVPLYLLSPNVESELQQRVRFVQAMPVHNLGITITLLVAVAIHEELVFRALLLPYLHRLFGSWWWAGAISAGIFALLHVPEQGMFGGMQVFGIAIVLTVLFIKTRSLLTVATAHFLFDFLQFQAVRLLPYLQHLAETPKASS